MSWVKERKLPIWVKRKPSNLELNHLCLLRPFQPESEQSMNDSSLTLITTNYCWILYPLLSLPDLFLDRPRICLKYTLNKPLSSLSHYQIMRWALAVRAQDGATPVSAAGTVIICPKTVHGAKTTILCQVINVIGTVDGTTAPAGSRGVDVDVIERTSPLSPVLPPCAFQATGQWRLSCLLSALRYWGKPLDWSLPSVKVVLYFWSFQLCQSHSILSSWINLKITLPWIPKNYRDLKMFSLMENLYSIKYWDLKSVQVNGFW